MNYDDLSEKTSSCNVNDPAYTVSRSLRRYLPRRSGHATVTDNKIVFGNFRCRRDVLMEPNCDAATVRIENNREVNESDGLKPE